MRVLLTLLLCVSGGTISPIEMSLISKGKLRSKNIEEIELIEVVGVDLPCFNVVCESNDAKRLIVSIITLVVSC